VLSAALAAASADAALAAEVQRIHCSFALGAARTCSACVWRCIGAACVQACECRGLRSVCSASMRAKQLILRDTHAQVKKVADQAAARCDRSSTTPSLAIDR
jgi:hypothetical protein